MSKTAKGQDATVASEAPTFIEFILDETGSMCSLVNTTVGGFNDFLKEQQAQTGQCLMTLTKFHSSRVRTPYTDLEVQMAPKLSAETFQPDGGTNLRDTIISRIDAAQDRLGALAGEANVVMIVMTDGEDTCSRYTERDVAARLKERMDHGWTFVFLAAYERALPVAEALGFPLGNSKSFARSEVRETMTKVAHATTAYRSTRSSGLVASGTTSSTYFSGEF